LQCVAVCCSVLQCVAACCSVLQCVAVCGSVWRCVAVCCSVLHYLCAKRLGFQASLHYHFSKVGSLQQKRTIELKFEKYTRIDCSSTASTPPVAPHRVCSESTHYKSYYIEWHTRSNFIEITIELALWSQRTASLFPASLQQVCSLLNSVYRVMCMKVR